MRLHRILSIPYNSYNYFGFDGLLSYWNLSLFNWKQFDTVPVLFEVLEKVIEDDFNPDSSSSNGLQQIKNNPRKKLLLPILQTFVNLSRRNGITELQMYFGNPSKQELIHKLKEEADEDIRE